MGKSGFKTTILLPLIACIFLSCEKKALKVSNVIPYEKETYEVVAFCLSQRESIDKDGNLRDKLTNESYHETDYLVSKIKNVFPKEDFRIIQRQLNDTIAFQLRSEKLLAEVNLISDDTISKMFHKAEQANNSRLFWEQYHGKYGEKALITISKPIFSKNGVTAVVSLGYSYGRLSGYGQTFVLEKVNKKWKIKKLLSMWIS